MEVIEQSGFSPATGIYHSQWDSSTSTSLQLPSSPSLSLPQFLLSTTLPPPHLSSKPAFIDAISGATLSYQDLRAATSSAARALHSLGIKKGDVILLVSPNFLHFPALVLGIMSLGAVFSTANFLLTRHEIQSQVQDSNPALIVTTNELSPKLHGLIPRPLVLVQDLVCITCDGDPPHVQVSQTDTAALMYSSGTTGKSKAVICSHGNLIAMSCLLRHVWGHAGRACDEVYLCVVPLFHMFGFSVFVCGAVAVGSTVVILPKYTLEDLLMAVEEHGVTRLPAVPPMVIQMGRSCHVARGYGLGSLKEVICSGAPISREHMERFTKCYPWITLSQCYGLTETSGPITLCDGVKGRYHTSIGRLIPYMEAKIIDARTKKALSPNKLGELCIRGPPVMQGYLNHHEATSTAIDKEGWLHTGDLCYIDMRGLIYIVDRIKELIKYKAYQVAPVELEEILSTHSDIKDVAVVSYPDEDAGEIPMACVVRRDGSNVREEDIISFMEDKVAPYKKIRKVLFVDFIPRSPSGKILRRHLKEVDVQQQRMEISSRL